MALLYMIWYLMCYFPNFYDIFVFVPFCAFVIFNCLDGLEIVIIYDFGYPQACSLCSLICIGDFLYVLFAWK